MRIGLLDIDTRTPAQAIVGAQAAAERGVDTYWLPGGWRDPLTLLAVAGQHVKDVDLGAAIVSTYGTHPTMVAEQALTVNGAVNGRLILGLGTSHQHMVEHRFGLSFAKPIRYLREYLTILTALLDTGSVDFVGEVLSAQTELRITGMPRPAVLVAALSDQSLRVAGRLADGTITNWLAPRALETHTIPTITAAASEAGRPRPRIVANMPMCVTSDEAGARTLAAEQFGIYSTRYTAYKATFDRQGVDGPAALVVTGDEDTVTRELRRYSDIGVDEFCVHLFGSVEDRARTDALINDICRRRATSVTDAQ
ncbi:MAG: Luciferase-like monooxygenase [Acidimicrobiia bacterium]|nr:Luciferase-like monooxygenase [Acidimicrobiia bacterium]